MPINYNIAIITPAANSYSETFVRAHKNLNGGFVKFYYGNHNQLFLEGETQSSTSIFYLALKLFGKIIKKKNLGVQSFLLNSFKKNNVKLVLVEYGTTAGDFLDILNESKLPFIVHFHGYDASKTSIIEEYQSLYKRVFEKASLIVAVSLVMQKKLIELGCSEQKILYNVYGPSNDFLEVIPTFEERFFLSVGRFVDKKAPYYTIFAFHKIVAEFPDAKLIMCGDGELLNVCQNIVRYLKLEDYVLFPGVIDALTFKKYLSKCLAYVQHSITAASGDMEGTPVSIIEASAAGVPVISTYHAGIPDVIIHNETGLLVDEHNIDGMALNMRALLIDTDFAKTLGGNGKNRIKAQFSLTQHLSKLDLAIEKIIN